MSLRRIGAALLLALFILPADVLPQDIGQRCRPDELDMGDYCASLKPPETEEEASTRRVTPFRARSMMPGRVDEAAAEDAPEPAQPAAPAGPGQSRAEPAAESVHAPGSDALPVAEAAPPVARPEAASADISAPATPPPAAPEPAARPVEYGPDAMIVQLGIFSERAVAERVLAPLLDNGLQASLAPLDRGGGVLWASVHGPFTDKAAAEAAARYLRAGKLVKDTYVKPLGDMQLIELNHDATEE